MTDLVPQKDIARLVGRERHATDHYGRINTAERKFYILHSRECLNSGIDLRQCKFSLALDQGLGDFEYWHTDVPVLLHITEGKLTP